MRKLALVLALAFSPALAACGEDAGLSFGSLQGAYAYVTADLSCQGRVSGSKVTGSCDTVPSIYDDGSYKEMTVSHWEIEGTLGDSNVAARVVHTEDIAAWWDGSCTSANHVTTYEGSASKSSGSTGTGPFAAMAGMWSATVSGETIVKAASVDDGVTADDCLAGRGVGAKMDRERQLVTWSSQTTLTAQTGAITWKRTSSDYWYYDEDGSTDHYSDGASDYTESTQLTATPSDDIVVDGYVVDKL
ncbi:MAG: hypothetical protein KC635_02695 [Myxococcales bacterium]|nr:hypothetical protein [Myxococcales bacterium]MCB9734579.1 hypothetical protein [Deltaproteobacteria bacterium]